MKKTKGDSTKKLKSLFCSELGSAVVTSENYNSVFLVWLRTGQGTQTFSFKVHPNIGFSVLPMCSGLFLNSEATDQKSRPKEVHRVYWPLT